MAKSNDIAIRVDGVSKAFKLPHEKQSSIKGAFVNMFSSKRTYERQQVLKDISFEIKKGEFFGIVGRNGSGKSTLLKLMAGIYAPDKGNIQVNGKLTPFIELGVGFNPELTGRENVFLNGALLGFSRKEMAAMYDEIVEFAELEKFMDQKLKNYSSGMQVRLAFSVAIRANTEILILDEVLAVGDEAFQKKCYRYFAELKRNKKTVVLVTHDMSAVERFCSRAIFVDGGQIKKKGDPYKIAASYSKSNDDAYTDSRSAGGQIQKKSDISVNILNSLGKKTQKFTYGDKMTVDISWTNPEVESVGVSVIHQGGEYVFGQNTYQDKYNLGRSKRVAYEVMLNLGEGDYFLKVGLFGQTDHDRIDFLEVGPTFSVARDYNDSRWGGLTKLDYRWNK